MDCISKNGKHKIVSIYKTNYITNLNKGTIIYDNSREIDPECETENELLK